MSAITCLAVLVIKVLYSRSRESEKIPNKGESLNFTLSRRPQL